jgi:hypothetical protein
MPSCVNKRLCDKDVRAIFECLRDPSKQPPLDLQIVTVGPNGLKLSPPSYEFDGTNEIFKSTFTLLGSDSNNTTPTLLQTVSTYSSNLASKTLHHHRPRCISNTYYNCTSHPKYARGA